jgi:hypothetical protein
MIQQFVWYLKPVNAWISLDMEPLMVQIFGKCMMIIMIHYNSYYPLHDIYYKGWLIVILTIQILVIKTRSGPTTPMGPSLVCCRGNVWNLQAKMVIQL